MRKEINEEKLRDMVRSILPSTHRIGPPWAKAARKRDHRRKVRIELHMEDPETTKADVARDVYVVDIVEWRRAGDKLSHFLRWCERITAGMELEEALGFIRGLLPRGVIGDHAYGHWEWHRGPRHYRGKPFVRRIPERELQSFRDSGTFRLRRALERDPALHKRLNAEIKSRRPFDEARRLLSGLHDVASFVNDIAPRKDDPYDVERSIMLKLIAETEKGGHQAALRISNAFGSWRRSPPRATISHVA